MNFKGQHVTLSYTSQGITLRMLDGNNSVSLFLTDTEGAQLLTYLKGIYGLEEVKYEEETDELKRLH